MKITTLADAKTFVDNSGVLDWDWDHPDYSNGYIVDTLLPQYVYENMQGSDEYDDMQDREEFNAVLRGFVRDILQQDPNDYGLR